MKLNLFLTVIILASSCEYDTAKIYSPDVSDSSEPPAIHNLSLDLEYDTIHVYFDHTYEFNFKSSDQPVKWVKVVVDTTQMVNSYSENGSFVLHRQQLTQGFHTLRLEVFVGSGTGSLADKLGLEGFLFGREWILSVEPLRDNRIRCDIRNGFLRLEWDELKSPDIKQYILFRQATFSSETTFEIAKLNNTYYVDSAYIGEGGEFSVDVELTSGKKYRWGIIRIPESPPIYSFKATTENEYYLTWPGLKYYGSIGKLEICKGLSTDVIDSVLVPENDNYRIEGALFSDYMYYTIIAYPKYQYSSNRQFRKNISVFNWWGMGYPSPEYDDVDPYGANEIIYKSGKSIYRYSLIENKILQSRNVSISYTSSLSVSPGGKYMVFHNIPQGMVIFSAADDFNKDVVEMQVPGLKDNYGSTISLSDNGTGIFRAANGKLQIYDFLNGCLLLQHARYYASGDYLMSPAGKYICHHSDSVRMFRFQDNNVIPLWQKKLTSSVKYLGFLNSSPEQLIFSDGQNIYFKDCETFVTINQFPFENKKIVNMDLFNKKILAYSPGHLYVFDLLNGSLLIDIPTNLKDYHMEYVRTYGNSIITINGLRYFL